jgi:aspartate/tyrosine/aromatic aminotransferase
MSLHINRFIDRVKAADARGQRDFIMSMADAKDLHADITKLLLALQVLHEQKINSVDTASATGAVEITGGSF